MPRVAPQWVEGRACPRCGRPLMWIGHWRRDFNSPDGRSFVREPFTYHSDTRIARDDREVTRVVARNGYEGKTVKQYEHVCTMCCPRCGRDYSGAQASHVPPPPPEKAPAGYYLSD